MLNYLLTVVSVCLEFAPVNLRVPPWLRLLT
jgi:hypothetical protein